MLANGNKSELTWEDFATYLPQYNFDEKQMEFFKDTFETIISNRDTSKVTCFSQRCGIGKSTFIHTFMHCCIGNCNYNGRKKPQGLVVITDSIKRLEELSNSNKDRIEADKYWGEIFEEWGVNYNGRKKPQGLVVITDSIKRLEELSNSNKDRIEADKYWGEIFEEWGVDNHYKEFENNVIVLKSDEPFKEQLINQHYRPIVLLSTQRYFMLSDKVREQLFSFTYRGKPMKRDIVIFDESPSFSEIVTIDSNNLTRIEAALYNGLSNEVQDKEFVIREYKAFKDRLLDQMDEKEKLRKDSNVIIYWKDERYSSITPNDELLFKVISDNIEPLTKEYNCILKDMLCLQEIAQHGAIFKSVKKKYGKYERSFVVVVDNRNCFYLNGDTKFFVFDATADIDPRYDLDYVELIKGEKYNIPLKLMITNVKITTSKNVLCRGKKSQAVINIIIKYLKEQLIEEKEKWSNILIVVYSELLRTFRKEFKQVGYFGNLKGFNDFKDLYRMAHVGMNRFPNMAYFFIYCGCHMEEYRNLQFMKEKESLQFFDSIDKNKNKEYENIITQITLRCMLADFEQNIFRLAIRNYKNTQDVHIWTFYNVEDKVYNVLSEMLEDRYKPYGAVFEYEDTPEELKIEQIN